MMANNSLCLTKDGHTYLFHFDQGAEEQIIGEIARMADDNAVNLDWADAAALSFQVAQNTAIECCAAMTPHIGVSPSRRESSERPHEAGRGGDDAKDGPCTNTNYPF